MVDPVMYTAANESIGYTLGYLFGAFAIPGLGLVLLIVGLRKRSQSRRQPGTPGYHPHPGQPPVQGAPPYQGQPQYPGQPPYPAQPPYQGAPYPSPPQKGNGNALIAIGAVVLMVGLLGVAASSVTRLRSSQLSVGDCITAADYDKRAMRPEAVDCSREDAIYELASTGDGSANCPDGERERSNYSALTNDKMTYCFLLNFAEGACVDVDTVRNLFHPAPCSSATAKVDRRVDGSTDESECGSDTNAVSYPEPKRLYCFVSP